MYLKISKEEKNKIENNFLDDLKQKGFDDEDNTYVDEAYLFNLNEDEKIVSYSFLCGFFKREIRVEVFCEDVYRIKDVSYSIEDIMLCRNHFPTYGDSKDIVFNNRDQVLDLLMSIKIPMNYKEYTLEIDRIRKE